MLFNVVTVVTDGVPTLSLYISAGPTGLGVYRFFYMYIWAPENKFMMMLIIFLFCFLMFLTHSLDDNQSCTVPGLCFLKSM